MTISNSVSHFAMVTSYVGIFIVVEPEPHIKMENPSTFSLRRPDGSSPELFRTLTASNPELFTIDITYNKEKRTYITPPIPIPKTCRLSENPYSSGRVLNPMQYNVV